VKAPNWTGDWPIPKRINLPGVRIKVKVVPQETLDKLGSRVAAWVYRAPDGIATIYLSGEFPLEVQRYALLHELQHAAVELLDAMIEKFPEHVQSESMAKWTMLTTAELAKLAQPAETTS